jgi:hypothetical protein
MKEFKVTINRIAYSTKEFSIEANSEEEAKQKAMQLAADTEFSEKDADYEVESINQKQ